MPAAVHQFLPTFASRDAIGAHALEVQRVLRGLGLESEIYTSDAHGDTRQLSRSFRRFRPDPATPTWLLYQYSVGSGMAEELMRRSEPLIVNSHNVTPESFYKAWEPHIAYSQALGRRQLAELAARAELGIAVSAYNEAELREAGFRRTAVVPILVDVQARQHAPEPATLARLGEAKRGGGADLLFVGRIAPNKAQHDLLKAFAFYRRVYDPTARLHLVGGTSSNAYLSALLSFIEAVGLDGAVDLAGSVSDAELAAYYRSADAFVCLSEHEGFLVPLLEAMHHRVPIVAFASAAVPETLGDGGLLLEEKAPALVAAATHRVVTDPELRRALTEAGSRRLQAFDVEQAGKLFAETVCSVVGVP